MKVEGEKNYHLRIAAILGDVEAEVSCKFYLLLWGEYFPLRNLSLFFVLQFLLGAIRETA